MQHDLAAFQRDFAAAIDAPATGAMAVYRNTVLHGAVEALRANYPVVEQILGSDMFGHAAVDFASEYPPGSPALALYGREFAEWLGRQCWADDLPYLGDVARVERLHTSCLFAADAEHLGIDRVRGICRDPNARVRLHPAVRFGWLATPAMSIWLAHQHSTPATIAPDWKAEGALFARPSPFTVHTPRIGRAAHRMLFGIRFGEPVSASIAAASQLYPGEDCTAVFASLAGLGVFAVPEVERIN